MKASKSYRASDIIYIDHTSVAVGLVPSVVLPIIEKFDGLKSVWRSILSMSDSSAGVFVLWGVNESQTSSCAVQGIELQGK